MGNTMPCLVVHQGTPTKPTTVPPMKPGKRIYSVKLVVKALHEMKKVAKIVSRTLSEAAWGGAVEGGGEVKSARSPRRATARHGGRGGGKGVVRVKVVLTKEEAARLLSLTVGGRNTAAQIVAEIKRMEEESSSRRAAAAATAPAWRPGLTSIPEESW